jgi:hypothetical protein
MKMTLLEMIQSIASDMESSEINSYDENTEALQITNIIERTYYDIRAQLALPEHENLFKLDAVGGPAKPTKMVIPTNVVDVTYLKYNKQDVGDVYPRMENVTPINLEEFISRMYDLPAEVDATIGSYTDTINGDAVTFFYRKDKAPTVYASFDDNTIIFDSFDQTLEANLQQTNSLGFGKIIPVFTRSNTFIPSIDVDKFPLFLEECAKASFYYLKQTENKLAVDRSRKHMIRTQFDKRNVKINTSYGYGNDSLPHYGRK